MFQTIHSGHPTVGYIYTRPGFNLLREEFRLVGCKRFGFWIYEAGVQWTLSGRSRLSADSIWLANKSTFVSSCMRAVVNGRCLSWQDAHTTWVPVRGAPCIARRAARHIARAEVDVIGKLKDKSYLDAAAKRFALGVEKGIDEDEMIALELGGMTDTQAQYKDKIKEKLQQRAAELKAEEQERLERMAKNYLLGCEAYECGEYAAAVRLLERGVEEVGIDTIEGGDCQLWLALAYQALGREKDAIDTCLYVEKNHPVRKMKKRAEDLRYILEAPKLEISDEEHVKIPLIVSDTWRKKDRKSGVSRIKKLPKKVESTSYWDREIDWSLSVPNIMSMKWYYRVAWAAVFILVTIYVNMHATSSS